MNYMPIGTSLKRRHESGSWARREEWIQRAVGRILWSNGVNTIEICCVDTEDVIMESSMHN